MSGGVPLADAFVRVRADGTQLKPDVDAALDKVDGKGHGSKIGGAFSGGFGAAMGGVVKMLGGIFAAVGIANFAKEAVQSFSDVEDASAAASVVFGDSMGKIEAQAQSAATTMGMSRAQVIDAANTFGTFGKSAGLTGDALADFSAKMTATAGDMASFKGGTPEEAIQAVGAALRGETEPIRRYGVLLDDASMRAQAMKMGLISTTKDALTPQQKVLAAQALILKQTSDAQGDFARTSDSTANTQKTLNAVWENTKAIVGEQLAPVFTFVRGVLIGLLTTVGTALPAISGFLGDLSGQFAPVMSGLQQVFGFLFLGQGYDVGSGPPWVESLISGSAEVTAALRELQAVAQLFLGALFGTGGDTSMIRPEWVNPIIDAGTTAAGVFSQISASAGGLFGAIGSYIATILPIYQSIAGFLMTKFQEVLPVLGAVFLNLGSIISSGLSIAQSIIQTVTGVISALWRDWGATLTGVASGAINMVVGVVRGFSDILAGIFKVIASALKGDWSGAWEGIKQIASGAVGVVRSTVEGFGQMLSSVFNGIKDNLGRLFTSAWEGIKSAAKSGADGVMDLLNGLPGRIGAALAGLGDIGRRAGESLLNALAGGIRDMAGRAYDAAQDALASIARLFPHSPADEGPFSGDGYTDSSGLALVNDFGRGILSGRSGLMDSARSVMGDLDRALDPSAYVGLGASAAGLSATGTPGVGLGAAPGSSARLEALLQQLIEEVRSGQTIELDGDAIGRTTRREGRSRGLVGV